MALRPRLHGRVGSRRFRARRRDKSFRNVVATGLRPVHFGAGVHIKYDGPQGRGYSNCGFT
jgi:hypothetical protein